MIQKTNHHFNACDFGNKKLFQCFVSTFQDLEEKFLKVQIARQLLFEYVFRNESSYDIDTLVIQCNETRVCFEDDEPDVRRNRGL